MIFFVFLVISSSPWQPAQATTFTQILPESGRVLLNHVIQSFSNVFSFMECVKKCEANVGCHSVNMHTDRGVCEVNSHTHLSNPEHLVPASNASHYILYFFRPLLLCNSQLCSDPNNEVCFINSDGMSYRCQGCNSPLGLQDKRITNAQMSSSANFGPTTQAWEGRLHFAGAWIAPMPSVVGQYLQIDLESLMIISHVATQGRGSFSQWITSYSLKYSLEHLNWFSYKYANIVQVFQANFDMHTVVTRKLPLPIKTRYIRIVALSWNLAISLRAELYGCTAP